MRLSEDAFVIISQSSVSVNSNPGADSQSFSPEPCSHSDNFGDPFDASTCGDGHICLRVHLEEFHKLTSDPMLNPVLQTALSIL